MDCLFGFTGRPVEKVSGLQNNLNRWYDATVGRWLSEDPVGFLAGDTDTSRYVGNQVSRLLDPTGLNSEEITVSQARKIAEMIQIMANTPPLVPAPLVVTVLSVRVKAPSNEDGVCIPIPSLGLPLARLKIKGEVGLHDQVSAILKKLLPGQKIAVLELGGHADGRQGISVGMNEYFGSSDVGTLIAELSRLNGSYTAPSIIVLCSCYLGNFTRQDSAGTGTSFVQAVATATGKPVLSPKGYVDATLMRERGDTAEGHLCDDGVKRTYHETLMHFKHMTKKQAESICDDSKGHAWCLTVPGDVKAWFKATFSQDFEQWKKDNP